jgi:hypothetical protein
MCFLITFFHFLIGTPRICEELVKGEKSKDEFDNLIPLINNQFVTFIKQNYMGLTRKKVKQRQIGKKK